MPTNLKLKATDGRKTIEGEAERIMQAQVRFDKVFADHGLRVGEVARWRPSALDVLHMRIYGESGFSLEQCVISDIIALAATASFLDNETLYNAFLNFVETALVELTEPV